MPVNKRFKKKVRKALDDQPLRAALDNFARAYPQARAEAYKDIDFEALRRQIKDIKGGAVEQVETLARQFEHKITDRGGVFHLAADGAAVARIIKDIARRRKSKLCVKSKSMATEEIRLNERLKDTLRVVETDLGEWIIQQIDERPTHMVMPAIHLTRQKCAEIFSKAKGYKVEPDIPHMVKLARDILRAEFLEADMGISGCNIAVAETGTMVLFTNEGNGRLTSTLPPVHVVVLGYEKLVPRFKDIAPLAAAVPRSATCQSITSYVTMISGPSETFKAPGDNEIVPRELHVILMDNGRLELLKDPVFKDIGRCVRCASCLNVCPVYGLVGGQVYGDVYAGGIGALLTAFFASPEEAEKIQEMCLGCGKCVETCPGSIDIPGLILQLRGRVRDKIPPPFIQRLVLDKMLPRKKMLDLSIKAAAPGMRLTRQFPNPAPRTFRQTMPAISQEITDQKGTAAFFYGCMIDYMYPEIGEAVVFLLNRAGYRVEFPEQDCCGAPPLYSGLEETAARLAAGNLPRFDNGDYDYIVTACPTGTVMMTKQWRRLLKDEPGAPEQLERTAPKTIDCIQLLHRLLGEGRFPGTSPEAVHSKFKTQNSKFTPTGVVYHYSCHLKRELGLDREPREVLEAVPGVRWIEMDEADRCCGFAGSYSLKLPDISSELLTRKVSNIEASGAEVVLTDCPGCLLSLRRGLEAAKSKIRAEHTAVFLKNLLRDK